jgi:ABC-type Fe3+/spermidine/putrescine transport system ATPase subunit
MQREIKQLQQQLGLTVIYITHDQEEALSLSDRIAIMRTGRVEQVGTPRELYEKPDNLYIAEFLGGSNVLPGVAGDRTAEGYWEIRQDAGVTFRGCAVGALQSGRPVRAMMRPENVRLSPAAVPGENSCIARVVERKYLGDVSFMHVRLASGAMVSCKDLTQRFGDELRPDDAVHAVWHPDATRIYPADAD